MTTRPGLPATIACLGILAWSAPARGQQVACDPPAVSPAAPNRDLYCIELFPTARAGEARGTVALTWVPGPFTVSVTREGTPEYGLVLDLERLPPRPPGPGGFVAWAVTPTMERTQRLGTVHNGRSRFGPVALDRFAILISAEPDTASPDRRGALLLRGESASSRLRPPDLFQFALGAVNAPPAGTTHQHGSTDASGWRAVPMLPGLTMLPSEMALRPPVAAWLPESDSTAPMVRPRQVVKLAEGDTLDLVAGLVRRVLAGRIYTMFGFNGQQPGPLLQVEQGSSVVIRFTNRLPMPSTVHWHGIRLASRFDGVPGVSQPPVEPGATFIYQVRFPDGGLYWYHPHVREDIQQDLGLYGNIFVHPSQPWEPVDREEFLMLDDLLADSTGLIPYGADTPTHAAMGRIGNLFLVNGEVGWTASARPGERIRLYLTNAANARTFNLSFSPATDIALVGADVGQYDAPIATDHVVLAPAERYVVEVRFSRPGRYALVNRVKALDHLFGRFFPRIDTLGFVNVGGPPMTGVRRPRSAAPDSEMAAILARQQEAEHRTLDLRVGFAGLPFVSERLMRLDSLFFLPVEWAGTMPGMNWSTVGTQAHWLLHDPDSGRDNEAIGWEFRRGSLLHLRLRGARDVLHAMQHPIHLHGQRFLILAVGGIPSQHPVWKDTVLVPAGTTVDLLVDLSNPGTWMLHCHIAEHLGAGMMTTIHVVEE